MIAADLALGIGDDLAEQISHFTPEDKIAVATAFLSRVISELPAVERVGCVEIIRRRLLRIVAAMAAI